MIGCDKGYLQISLTVVVQYLYIYIVGILKFLYLPMLTLY